MSADALFSAGKVASFRMQVSSTPASKATRVDARAFEALVKAARPLAWYFDIWLIYRDRKSVV